MFLVLITAIYTTFGGIKAVVWTDLLQVVLMFGAMFYATWTLWHSVGGWEGVTAKVRTTPVDAEVVEARTQDLLKKPGNQFTAEEARARATEVVAADSAEAAGTALNFSGTAGYRKRGSGTGARRSAFGAMSKECSKPNTRSSRPLSRASL